MIDPLAARGPVLVVAPHPDDEVLGAGGTMARLADAGRPVDVAVVTAGRPPAYPPEQVEAVRREAAAAHARLGVRRTHWLDLPAAELGETAHGAVNAAIDAVVRAVAPTLMLVPFVGDIHLDHQRVFLSALVAARPHGGPFPATVLAYETMSETNWNAPYLAPNFVPNVFVEIAATLPRKLEAMALFASQLRPFPHERSTEALAALAALRGATVHRRAAEGFVLIRHVA